MSAEVTTPLGMVDTGTAPSELSSNALPIGTRVHEFEITRVIGEGGFSVVYLAFDHTLHRSIALKEYIPSALASRRHDNTVAVRSAQHQQTFEAGLRSFINEARLLAQFDHPALVKVYRFWEGNGTAYMAMPYYGGRTLKQILRERPEQATEAWLKQLLVPLLDALELLHRHRCYHRDIAPDNIQILENEAPVLLDFGAARRTIGDMTQAFTVILKPGYAPIEQYADEADLKQGPWTDVYALAAVLYGAVAHKPPPTAVARVIKDPLEPLAKRSLPGYGVGFLSGIDRGLGVRPEERPQSIGEWRRLLGVQAAATQPKESAAASPPVAAAPELPAAAKDPGSTTIASPAPDAVSVRVSGTNDPESGAAQASAERDRTVLVPGLRRPTSRVNAHTPRAPDATFAGHARELPRSAFLQPRVLGAVAGVVAVAVAALAFNHFRTPGSTVVSQASTSVPASERQEPTPPREDAGARASPAETKSGAGAASPAETAASVEASAAATGTTDESVSKTAPEVPATTKASSGSKAPSGPSAPGTMPPAGSKAASGASSVDAVIEPKLPSIAMAPAGPPKASPVQPALPAIPDSERRWAAIKDSNRLADFYAFQLEFPKSPRARDVAVRIDALERALKDKAGAQATPVPADGKAKETIADEQVRPGRTESPARPAGAGSKAIVRIRVRPFGYVYVDGAEIGPSPPVQDVPMSPGKHRIEARNSGATPPVVSTEIDVTGTKQQDVQLRFSE